MEIVALALNTQEVTEMELPYPQVDLTAPIVPNQGLGGISLRTPIADLQDLVLGLGITKAGSFAMAAPFDARYHLGRGEVTIAVDIANGKVFMLSAGDRYTGALFGKIYVGMRVGDALNLEPNLYYDEAEEQILCRGYQGLSIDIPETDPPLGIVPGLKISAINVYAEESRTLEGQRGQW